jgi:hypothetical protein
MANTDDFFGALALAILFGVSIVVIIEILKELTRSNKPLTQENVANKLRDHGYNGKW